MDGVPPSGVGDRPPVTMGGLDMASQETSIITGGVISTNEDVKLMQSTKRSAANRLIELAVGEMDLFQHDEIAYAALIVGGHRETHSVRSRWIRPWLQRKHWQQFGEAARPAAINLTLDTLEAIATDPALPPRQVYRRVASVGEKLYLDLSNADWTCVEIDASGWRVVPDGPYFMGIIYLTSQQKRELKSIRNIIS